MIHISEAIKSVIKNLPPFGYPQSITTTQLNHLKLDEGAYICSPDRCEYNKQGTCPACGNKT